MSSVRLFWHRFAKALKALAGLTRPDQAHYVLSDLISAVHVHTESK